MDPLAGLDEVPWEKLRHAYGSAANVPRLLRAWAQGDSDADRELGTSIVHQGTIYDATAPAIPFLLALLRVASTADRRTSLLVTLASIANGRSWAETHAGSSEEVERGREWTRANRDALRKGIPTYVGLLGDADRWTREYAFAAVARLLPTDDATVGHLVDALRREQNADTRDAMAPAFAEMLDVTSRRIDLLTRALAGDESSGAQLAYFALRWGHTENLADKMLDIARAVSTESCNFGDPLEVMLAAPQPALDAIVALLPQAPTHKGALALARAGLCLAFDRPIHDSPSWTAHGNGRGYTVWERGPRPAWFGPRSEEPCMPAAPLGRGSLNAAQERVLAAIASSDEFFLDPTDLLAIFGAPTDRDQLRAFLGALP